MEWWIEEDSEGIGIMDLVVAGESTREVGILIIYMKSAKDIDKLPMERGLFRTTRYGWVIGKADSNRRERARGEI